MPSEPVPVPEVVADIAAGRSVVAVWVNELGGVTFQVGSGAAREFVKVSPPDWAHHDADQARIEAFQRLWNAGDISSH